MESIQLSLEQIKESFNCKMAAFQNELHKASTAPLTLNSLASDFNLFKNFITTTLSNLQVQIDFVAKQQDQLEMRTRRKMLLLHGVEEGSNDSTSDVVKIFSDKLRVPELSIDSISRSHRMGRLTSGKPRPILIKFRDAVLRDRVWFTKTALKNSGVTLTEFLNKGRHDAFLAARKHFGVAKCWTRDGVVVVGGLDGRRHRVTSVAEVTRLIDTLPVAVDSVPTSVHPNAPKVADAVGTSRSKRITKK
ncbi:uncharacterized protein ACR2FA_002454 [Aphomia sociella]